MKTGLVVCCRLSDGFNLKEQPQMNEVFQFWLVGASLTLTLALLQWPLGSSVDLRIKAHLNGHHLLSTKTHAVRPHLAVADLTPHPNSQQTHCWRTSNTALSIKPHYPTWKTIVLPLRHFVWCNAMTCMVWFGLLSVGTGTRCALGAAAQKECNQPVSSLLFSVLSASTAATEPAYYF